MSPDQLIHLPASSVWSRLARLLPPDSLKRSVAVLAGGGVLAQPLSLITAPIMARLYLPEDYGIVGVLLSVT